MNERHTTRNTTEFTPSWHLSIEVVLLLSTRGVEQLEGSAGTVKKVRKRDDNDDATLQRTASSTNGY